jgi:hypothetical protein
MTNDNRNLPLEEWPDWCIRLLAEVLQGEYYRATGRTALSDAWYPWSFL